MSAGASRGYDAPMRIAAPVEYAASAERIAPCRSSATWYFLARTSRRHDWISLHVSRDSSALRQLENLATCTQSASGLRSEGGANRSELRAHSNSAQRSSTSQPIRRSGLARRKAAIAGMA